MFIAGLAYSISSMRFVCSGKLRRFWAALLVLSCLGTAPLRAQTNPSVDEIIRNAVTRSQQGAKKATRSDYTYTKVTLRQEFDPSGHVKEHKEKVYQVSFQEGLTRVKLLSVNGRPPAENDVKEQSENDSNARQLLGSSKSERGDQRENLLTPELVERFDFTLIAQTNLNGRMAYQVTFQTKNPEPPVRHMIDRFLNRLSGTIWIDAEEYEVARADINLRSEVNLLGGVIGSLKRLAYTITRTRVADGIWLNTYSSGDFEGRKLIESLRIKTKSLAKNFRPLG